MPRRRRDDAEQADPGAGAQGDDERRVIFTTTAVFDRAQVDPLPDADPTPLQAPCEPLSGDSHAHLRERLADWCRSELGYNVEIRPVAGPAGGWCDTKARAIVVDATGAPNAQLRTLIHEAAHAMGVDYRSHSRERAEVIVESVFFSSGWLESSMAAGLHVGDGCYRGTSGSAIRRGCSGRRRGSALLSVSLPKTS
jgi:hypothetical protein